MERKGSVFGGNTRKLLGWDKLAEFGRADVSLRGKRGGPRIRRKTNFEEAVREGL